MTRQAIRWMVGGILVVLLIAGYTQGWFGGIFGAVLGSDYTATIDRANFASEGTFDKVIVNQGALELERLPEG